MQSAARAGFASSDESRSRYAFLSRPAGLIWLALAIALLGLFARIMTYPLQHDEHFYIPAGVLFSADRLYDDFGFSHLPNLPILLSAAFAAAGGHYVLIGRLVIFLAWLMTVAALILIGRRHGRSSLVAIVLVALLLGNPAMLDSTGMAVTNNFIATPFALFGLLLFIEAASRPIPSRRLMAAAGFLLAVAIGFKANYVVLVPPVAIAALAVPPHLPVRARLTRVALPLLAGAVIGGLPTLLFLLRDPSGFVAHVVSFHRGPQLGYWGANADPLDPKVMSSPAKALLAQRAWLSGANLILLLTLVFYAILSLGRARLRAKLDWARDWPVLLLGGITLLAGAVSFLPTPAFPQYYTIPVPFALMLIAFLHGTLDPPARSVARPFLIAVLVIAGLIGGPVLLSTLPRGINVAGWTGFEVHRDAQRLARIARADRRNGAMATLSPVYALEGGMGVYPSLAMGPFVYRAAAWIPADERGHYRSLTSPQTVASLLESAPPAAILIGQEGALDTPLSAFAIARGYIAHPVRTGRGGGAREMVLFTRPSQRPPVAFACAEALAASSLAAACRSAAPR